MAAVPMPLADALRGRYTLERELGRGGPRIKVNLLEDGSHFGPRPRLIQETLAWLDRYQPLPDR